MLNSSRIAAKNNAQISLGLTLYGQNECLASEPLKAGLTRCERSSRHRAVPFRLFLIASRNSAASIHLHVPLVTDPQRAIGLTRTLRANFLAHSPQVCINKGDARSLLLRRELCARPTLAQQREKV